MKNILIATIVVGLVFSACTPTPPPTPRDLTGADSCAEDGMTLIKYDGPKAQIVWNDGKRSLYCDVREAMPAWLDPARRRRIAALYVQDFAGAKWGSYKDRWISIEDATLVINSRQQGAMGVTWIPFSDPDIAHQFHGRMGGDMILGSKVTAAHLQAAAKLQEEMLNAMHTKPTTMPSHDMGLSQPTNPATPAMPHDHGMH